MKCYPSIGLVITVFRRETYIHNYIESTRRYHPDVDITVVNIKPDRDMKIAEHGVNEIVTDQQLSYSKSVNLGLKSLKSEVLVWGNDDIIVSGPFIFSLVSPIIRDRKTLAGINLCGDYLEGCLVAQHRDSLRDIGYLDERFPGCYEDVDYSRRAKEAGYDLVGVTTSNVRHVDLGQLDHKVNDSLKEFVKKWQI